MIETYRQEATAADVSEVQPGQAIIVVRQDEERAVVMHPDDFRRLTDLERDLEEIASARPVISELAFKALELEDVAGTPIEDPARITSLLHL